MYLFFIYPGRLLVDRGVDQTLKVAGLQSGMPPGRARSRGAIRRASLLCGEGGSAKTAAQVAIQWLLQRGAFRPSPGANTAQCMAEDLATCAVLEGGGN